MQLRGEDLFAVGATGLFRGPCPGVVVLLQAAGGELEEVGRTEFRDDGNPKWNTPIRVGGGVKGDLVLRVYDRDIKDSCLLGNCTVPAVHRLDSEETLERTLSLTHPKRQGRLDKAGSAITVTLLPLGGGDGEGTGEEDERDDRDGSGDGQEVVATVKLDNMPNPIFGSPGRLVVVFLQEGAKAPWREVTYYTNTHAHF
jgi:hypothetical protein